jgi:hypothetical protein
MTNNSNNNFDAFVSYFEQTGKDYAETIRKNLRTYGINAFVAHIEKSRYVGNFQQKINNVIANCKYFILLINIDTLERDQVIRECKTAYPNGLTENPKFVIFREDLEDVERSSERFLVETGIDLSKENQQDFRNDSQLASRILSLCKSVSFTKEIDTALQPGQDRAQYVSNGMVSSNKESVKKFKNKIHELNLWKHFEIKTFLFKSSKNNSWKIQFLYIKLFEQPPNQLEGLTTEHLKFIHAVHEIKKLDVILDQIALATEVTLNDISASLDLIPNELTFDSFYKSHPQSGIFGVKDACYKVLKAGNNSTELQENEIFLISEFKGSFDNLRDAVVDRLDLQFWDGTYAPFVVIIAPIPIETATVNINNQNLLMNLNCSPGIDPNHLKVMLQGRNARGRQVGPAQSLTGFRRLDNRQISLNSNVSLDNTITYLTLRLYNYDDLIEQQYFKLYDML